jgi:hypothetical protein
VRPGPALRLLDRYLRSLESFQEPLSSELAATIDVHLLDLVAATLGPSTEAANIVTERGVKAARLRAILAEVARRFAEPNPLSMTLLLWWLRSWVTASPQMTIFNGEFVKERPSMFPRDSKPEWSRLAFGCAGQRGS